MHFELVNVQRGGAQLLSAVRRHRHGRGHRVSPLNPNVIQIDDPELRQRVIDTVDRAIATAAPGQTEIDTEAVPGVTHTCVSWSWRSPGDTTAQKGEHADGADYEVLVDDEDDPDAGPWILVTTRPDLECDARWMPGQGFEDPRAFLDWFDAACQATL